MKSSSRVLFYVGLLLIVNTMPSRAQSVRSLVNGGNDLYDAKKYSDAEAEYRKSLEKDKNLLQGNFDLGDAVYKQNHYDEAIQQYNNALSQSADPKMQAKIYHNIGNAYCSSNQFQEGVNAYTKALKLNPKDEDTRYNLAYALKKIQEKQQKKDKDKDKKKDKQDQKQNQKQNEKQNQQQKQQDEKQKQQQQERKISKQEAERILEALKNDEKNTQKKLQKKIPVRINVDKDW